MPVCSASNCSYKHKNKQVCGKTIHKFPFSRPEILKKWIHNVGRENWYPSKSSVLCSDHFKKDCYEYSNLDSKLNRLKKDAVPSVFNHLLKSSKIHPVIDKINKVIAPKLSASSSAGPSLPDSNEPPNLTSSPNPEMPEKLSAQSFKGLSPPDLTSALKPETSSSDDEEEEEVEEEQKFRKIKDVRSLTNEIEILNKKNSELQNLLKVSIEKNSKINNNLIKYKKKLKIKQQMIRRTEHRISHLREQLDELEKKNKELEEINKGSRSSKGKNHDFRAFLSDKLSGLHLDFTLWLLNIKKCKDNIPDSIKTFAFVLNCFSPLAYQYVQSQFSNSLPHPRAVRRWQQMEKKRFTAEKNCSVNVEKNPGIVIYIDNDECSDEQMQNPNKELQPSDIVMQEPNNQMNDPSDEMQCSEDEIHHSDSEMQVLKIDMQDPEGDMQDPKSDCENPEGDMQDPKSDCQNPECDMQDPEIDMQILKLNVHNPNINMQDPSLDIQGTNSKIKRNLSNKTQIPKDKINHYHFPRNNYESEKAIIPILDCSPNNYCGNDQHLKVFTTL